MRYITNTKLVYWLSFVLFSIFASSCSNSEKQETELLHSDTISKNSGKVLNIKGKLFGIPSPFQTSFLIQKLGLPFEKEMLSSTGNLNKFQSDFQKSLMLGIYGSDLAYVVLYEKNQESLAYLSACKKLADDLGISSVFDNKLMDRIFKNISNKDSVLVLSSEAFRVSNTILKSNEHGNFTSLILAGGWIEGINIALRMHSKNPNQELAKRIGEQKQSLLNILDILYQYKTEGGFSDLITEFEKLKKIYEGLNTTYNFQKPETNAATQTTVIKSKSTIEISKSQIEEISTILNALRDKINNPN